MGAGASTAAAGAAVGVGAAGAGADTAGGGSRGTMRETRSTGPLESWTERPSGRRCTFPDVSSSVSK